MQTKEEYYHSVLKNRGILEDPNVMQCSCQHTLCEWHGRCKECVAIHRYHGDHLPACMRTLVEDKVAQLARVAKMDAVSKDTAPLEYQLYIRTRDKLKTKR